MLFTNFSPTSGCNAETTKENYLNLPLVSSKNNQALESGGYDYYTCTPSKCSGTFANSGWLKRTFERLCNCRPYEELPSFATASREDPDAGCFSVDFIQENCFYNGEASTCTFYELKPCGSGPPVEICDDYNNQDEDGDGVAGCKDSDCHTTMDCIAQCDLDKDGHLSLADCNGDDCVDNPALNPNAKDIFPGKVENTEQLCGDGINNDCSGGADCADSSCKNAGFCPHCLDVEICDDVSGPDGDGLDENCDGFINCADPSCNSHPSCQPGGGDPTPNYYNQQCYSEYMVTTYYYCHSEGCTYLYEEWEYMGSYCQITY